MLEFITGLLRIRPRWGSCKEQGADHRTKVALKTGRGGEYRGKKKERIKFYGQVTDRPNVDWLGKRDITKEPGPNRANNERKEP